MDSTTRLKDAQAKLEQMGFVDLKFFFSFGREDAKSDLQNSLADMLEGFMSGACKPSSFDDKYLIAA